jgi:hypothetical protein
MKFSEREEILQQREIRNEMYARYRGRFIASTIVIILAILSSQFIHKKVPDIAQPTQHDIEIAEELTTLDGRETAIDKKYNSAKIIAERTYGKDIISVFEVDYMYSFCVFEALEDGYWLEYCGKLFPKTELVKGTVYLGDNTHEYDIYLQYENIYSRLLVTQTNKKYTKHKEKQNISFDENGIGITKIDYHRTRYFKTQIEAFDAEGNKYILDDGGLF